MNPTPPPQTSLSDDEYARFEGLILDRTGLKTGERRRKTLERNLSEGALRTGCGSLGEYFNLLKASPTSAEQWDELIHAITICETYFFRDPEQIAVLRNHILPHLIARRWSSHELRLWCAGCSTGEEPYTLAILLRKLLPDIDRWKLHLLATDINRQALKKAQRAQYRAWSFRQVDESQRSSNFTNHGETWEIHPELRRMVTFAYLNLAEESYPSTATNTQNLDLILCRNVTIYLPEPVIRGVAERFHDCLAPGGWLMVGASEANDEIYHQFQELRFDGAMIYQKMGDAATVKPHPFASSPAYISTPSPAHGDAAPLVNAVTLPIPTHTFYISPPAPPIPPIAAPTEDPVEMCGRGEQLLEQHNLAEAREVFLQCAERFPTHSPALIALARLAANAGRLDEASRWAGRTLEGDPLNSEAHYMLALVHQERGEMEKALAFYKKTIYLTPENILAHFGAAVVYQKTGQPAAAARSRANALRLAKKLPPETLLPGSHDLTAGELAKMAGTV